MNRVVDNGRPLNSSDLLVQHLRIHVGNALNPPKGRKVRFYMFAYLLDAICAHNAFPSMNRACSPQEHVVHIHYKLLSDWDHRGVMENLTDHFPI